MCLAVPGKIISIHDDGSLMKMGQVRFCGIGKEGNLAYVPSVQVGEYVIVHVGFAISILNEEEAQKVFSYLQEIADEGGQ